MNVPRQGGFWRRLRVAFRWCRITVWLSVLALLCAAIYLNTVGLPDFLRARLLAELRRRGVELSCSRLYWSWSRGVVADNVVFSPWGGPRGPRTAAAQVAIQTDLAALCHGRIEPRSFTIHDGRVQVPLDETNAPASEFELTEVECGLRFLPEDEWQLDQFRARCNGVVLQLSGTLTHASEYSGWTTPETNPAPARPPEPPGAALAAQFREFTTQLRRFQFASPPTLQIQLHGDARDWRRFNGLLTLQALGAQTPWGSVTNFQILARLRPALESRTLPFGRVTLDAEAARTRWGTTEHLRLQLNCPASKTLTNCVAAELRVAAGRTITPRIRADAVRGIVHFTCCLTNPVPLDGAGELTLSRPRSRWVRADAAALRGEFRQNPAGPAPDASWAGWAMLAPYAASWQLSLTNASAYGLNARTADWTAAWQAPTLVVTQLQACLDGGQFSASGKLDVATRAAEVRGNLDCDPQVLAPVLPGSVKSWLDRVSFEQAPVLNYSASANLPPWTTPATNFAAGLLPTLAAEATWRTGPAAVEGIALRSSHGRVTFRQSAVRSLQFHATRPEGELDLEGTQPDDDPEIHLRLRSGVDPAIARPVLGAGAAPVFDLVKFTSPPAIEAELWLGRDGALHGGAGRLAVSNVTFRGESAERVSTGVRYTNRVIEFFQPEVLRANGYARTDGLRVDLPAKKLWITNGISTTDPMFLGRTIADHGFLDILDDYVFLQPPLARVSGVVALAGTPGFDLHVELEGGPLRWWRIEAPWVKGRVHYVGHTVRIENLQAAYRGGTAGFDASFDLAPTNRPAGVGPTNGAFMQFQAAITNVNLQAMMRDLTGGSKRLEGQFSAHLVITNAYSLDFNSWQGFAGLALTDGLVWEMPVFSVFSKMLNTFSPGLGNVRFSSASAHCVITNATVASRDFELDSRLLRISCRGKVDFHERIDAVVHASALRNVAVLGPLFNAVLWPVSKALEYKVTGTLDQPTAEPINPLTRLIMLPLMPLEAVTGILGTPAGNTNAPAARPEK